MLLTDLKPELEDVKEGDKIVQYLTFQCPKCPIDPEKSRFGNCLISIPVGDNHVPGRAWGMDTKDFNTMNITPSIWHHCESDPHFFIRSGNIEMC